MKKKLVSAVLAASFAAAMLAGCGSSGSSDTASSTAATQAATTAATEAAPAATEAATEAAADTGADEGKVLNIQCWNTEFQSRITDHYPGYEKVDDTTGKIGDVTVKWTITPSDDNAYQNNLDSILPENADAAADDKVDIFLVEADYALKYMNADPAVAMSMDELGITADDLKDQYQYTKDIVTDANGAQRGISWQACSAGLIYNREAAKAVLGTDDPDEVQSQLDSWDKFNDAAAKAKDAGYTMCSVNDTYRVYSNNVTTPWVVDMSSGVMTGQRASIRMERCSATLDPHGSSTSAFLLMMHSPSQPTAAGALSPDRSPSTGAAPGSVQQREQTTRRWSRTSC